MQDSVNPEVSKKFSGLLDEDFRMPLIPSKKAREVYFDLIKKNQDCFVFAEVPFPAIIDFERIKDKIGEYASYFWKARLDFVITDQNFVPIEAIEVQSPHHDYYKTRYNDKAKKFICRLAKIKFTIAK